MDNTEIRDYYQDRYNENDRMQRQPLEFLRCKDIISRYLTDAPMEIADIGGATGVFYFWLAQQGHSVHLLDYTPRHIEQARENGTALGLQLASYTVGDARAVPYADSQHDLALLMGPLYHLQSATDRAQCLTEAQRTLKPGGTVICEGISRYANLFESLHEKLIDDDRFIALLDENLATGNHSPGDTPYFTTAFMHAPHALAAELTRAGFVDVKLIAIEGFAFAFDTFDIFADERRRDLVLKYIKQTESNPDLIGATGHFIAVGRKP